MFKNIFNREPIKMGRRRREAVKQVEPFEEMEDTKLEKITDFLVIVCLFALPLGLAIVIYEMIKMI